MKKVSKNNLTKILFSISLIVKQIVMEVNISKMEKMGGNKDMLYKMITIFCSYIDTRARALINNERFDDVMRVLMSRIISKHPPPVYIITVEVKFCLLAKNLLKR